MELPEGPPLLIDLDERLNGSIIGLFNIIGKETSRKLSTFQMIL